MERIMASTTEKNRKKKFKVNRKKGPCARKAGRGLTCPISDYKPHRLPFVYTSGVHKSFDTLNIRVKETLCDVYTIRKSKVFSSSVNWKLWQVFSLTNVLQKSGLLDNWSMQLRPHSKEVLSKAEGDDLSRKKKHFHLVQHEIGWAGEYRLEFTLCNCWHVGVA